VAADQAQKALVDAGVDGMASAGVGSPGALNQPAGIALDVRQMRQLGQPAAPTHLWRSNHFSRAPAGWFRRGAR
jgi:hypothetical protein